MRFVAAERRSAWHALSTRDKHRRLLALRQRQQREVELEMLRLQAHVR